MAAKKQMISVDELKKKYYLFNNEEVRLTGRVAEKQFARQMEYMFEIYRPNSSDGWKKWVRLADLWVVRAASETVYVPKDLIEAVRKVVEDDV